jgi:t-SNARE complex subunit (syntaxin)
LQRYQDVERQYRQQYRQRVERQFKIGTSHLPFSLTF